MTADPFALHRVDTQYIEDSHTRMVAGKYEQRAMPIDVAEPDEYEEVGKGWRVFAIVVIVAFTAFGTYINFN